MEIFNSILHGSLHPQTGLTPADFPETSRLWDHCPETLPEIESRLKQVLGNILQLDFNTHTPVNINQYLNNQKYSPISLDYFPPEIAFPVPEPQTRLQQIYFFLITAEAKRIKLHLLQSAEILKDDICTKQETINTLKLLLRYAKQIREDEQPNPIFNFLFTQILKLYFEITIIFDLLLSATDYISFPDFFSRLNLQAGETETAAYQKALHIHHAKKQPAINPTQVKAKLDIAHKHVAFLNGINPQNNKRYMSESDYKCLVEYIEHLIQHETIPPITHKIPKSNIPKTWFKYTLYVIHQELYNSIQDIWIEFMQAVFDDFSPEIVEFSTLKTKFSAYPSHVRKIYVNMQRVVSSYFNWFLPNFKY